MNRLAQNTGKGFTNPALGKRLQEWLAGKEEPGTTFFQAFFPSLISLLFVVGALAFFFMLLWGAISWIMSGGDKGAVESARSRITSAVVGIFILLAMYAIINIIEVFFGINIITLDIGVLKIQ
jgi:hypothetical protein